MKGLFTAVTAKLETLPALKWVDEDKGQMNFERPPVVFPCALVDIQLPNTEDLNSKMQDCDAVVTVRLGFDFSGNTNTKTPAAARERSLKYYDVVDAVYNLLQGWSGGEFNPLSRKSFVQEKRPDGYKVVAIQFGTAFRQSVQ